MFSGCWVCLTAGVVVPSQEGELMGEHKGSFKDVFLVFPSITRSVCIRFDISVPSGPRDLVFADACCIDTILGNGSVFTGQCFLDLTEPVTRTVYSCLY